MPYTTGTETNNNGVKQMTVSKLAQDFAQALANGDLSIGDVGFVLEHIDGFLLDNAPDVATWIPRKFDEIASDLYKAVEMAA